MILRTHILTVGDAKIRRCRSELKWYGFAILWTIDNGWLDVFAMFV